jgi:hypothetical protein
MKSKKSKKEEENKGTSLEDAFADDEDVVYGGNEKKDKKEKKQEEKIEADSGEKKEIKASKPIEQIKKGDKIKIDGKEYEVDTQYVLIDHKITKEMAIEFFDAKTDKDYQIRYFTGRLDVADPELYELVNDFMYQKRAYKKLEF